jgi:probable rRNA maturation factor
MRDERRKMRDMRDKGSTDEKPEILHPFIPHPSSLILHPSAISIEIANQQAHLPLDRPLLRKAVRSVLRDAGLRKARISLAVVDDETIARLNWKYLRHRGPADVLSFVLDNNDGLEGEVIVGAQTALRAAPQYGWPPQNELLLYVIHGMLHLVGHDDRTAALRAEMQKRETEILEKLGIKRTEKRNLKSQIRNLKQIPSKKFK